MAASVSKTPPEGEAEKFDLIVIGGGSGGVACAKEAAQYGARVAIVDYVEPSPQGTSYGIGGTCVNVGCIPKKLMHYSGLLHESMKDAREYGWEVPFSAFEHSWTKLVDFVQGYVTLLSESTKRGFVQDPSTSYLNAKGEFLDPYTVWAHNALTGRRAVNRKLTAPHIVVAVGGRPSFPDDVPGARECCITSDDLFSLDRPPGKTLVVGASYIALECAGFLHELGFDVSLLVRSIYLRGFDQDIAERIGKYLTDTGLRVIRPAILNSFTRTEGGKVLVKYTHGGEALQEEFDTVLLAVGRTLVTPSLHLEKAGVDVEKDGSIKADDHQRTNIQHIYAIGDILHGAPQLTPVAIKTGRLISRRLFGGSTQLMNFKHIPTTVFTPLEYGCVGLSEEAAIAQFGPDNIEVYHTTFQPLEWSPLMLSARPKYASYIKLICLIPENNLVLGFHYLGPNAGEVTQGFATAMHLGATKEHFDLTIGIHPTCAEQLTTLKITKRSGIELEGAEGACTT